MLLAPSTHHTVQHMVLRLHLMPDAVRCLQEVSTQT
jgi:hypothetical protein